MFEKEFEMTNEELCKMYKDSLEESDPTLKDIIEDDEWITKEESKELLRDCVGYIKSLMLKCIKDSKIQKRNSIRIVITDEFLYDNLTIWNDILKVKSFRLYNTTEEDVNRLIEIAQLLRHILFNVFHYVNLDKAIGWIIKALRGDGFTAFVIPDSQDKPCHKYKLIVSLKFTDK